MSQKFDTLYESLVEKDEHKKSKEYKRLSPKMKDAVDQIFKKMDSKPSDFLNSFEKSIKDVSKKFKVSERELLGYFEKEMLSI
jgi:hypothetical protein|tara:strand:- start:27 stop:275 length:249 start_codon:yes stop_codon:yes gene_type:complete